MSFIDEPGFVRVVTNSPRFRYPIEILPFGIAGNMYEYDDPIKVIERVETVTRSAPPQPIHNRSSFTFFQFELLVLLAIFIMMVIIKSKVL